MLKQSQAYFGSSILIIHLLMMMGCKGQAIRSETKDAGVLTADAPSDDLKRQCEIDPGGCSAYGLLSRVNYSTSCINLWDQVRGDDPADPPMYAFDEAGNSYSSVPKAADKRKYGEDGRTKITTIDDYMNGRMSGKVPIDIPARLSEFFPPEIASKQPYGSFPVGYIDYDSWGVGSTATTLQVPKIIAVKAESAWQQNKDVQEWIFFQVQPAPPEVFKNPNSKGQRIFKDTEYSQPAQAIRGAIFSTCTLLGTATTPKKDHPTTNVAQKLSILEYMNVKNEGKKIAAKAKTLDQVYYGMVTFVENAPLTGEIATFYNGCALQESTRGKCLMAFITVAGSVAGYASMGGTKLVAVIGPKAYYATMAVGTAARLTSVGVLAVDAVTQLKKQDAKAAGMDGFNVGLNLVFARGLVVELLKKY